MVAVVKCLEGQRSGTKFDSLCTLVDANEGRK